MSQKPPHSQTLSRGIRVLEILAESNASMSIADVASALAVHRSIAYRIIRTLEQHALVVRDPAGQLSLGPRLASLARNVSQNLQSVALPELTQTANELGMTAFIALLDQHEVITLVSVEPRNAHATLAQRPGTRHPLAVGAPGIAIQSLLDDAQWSALAPEPQKRAEATEAAKSGYAISHDEVIEGLRSVAVPLLLRGHPPASLAVVYVATEFSIEHIARRLASAAATIASEL